MKKLSMIVLLVLVFSVTVVMVNAAPPTSFYLVSPGMPCRLPDASGQPQDTIASKVKVVETSDNFVQIDCVGALAAGATLPDHPMVLTYFETKVYCGTFYGESLLLSRAYSATVLPDGTSTISCLFRIH